MSAEIVNLRLVRKDKARGAKDAAAAENRARFGRTRSARKADEEARDRGERHLDGHRLRTDDAGAS